MDEWMIGNAGPNFVQNIFCNTSMLLEQPLLLYIIVTGVWNECNIFVCYLCTGNWCIFIVFVTCEDTWHYLVLCSPSWLSQSRLSLLHSAGDKIPGHAATHVQLYHLTDIGCAVGSVAGTVSDWKFIINCGQGRELFCRKKPDHGSYLYLNYNKQSDLVKSIEHVSRSCH